MQYLAVFITIITLLWLYHRIKYINSGYQRFEYYLEAEHGSSLTDFLIFYEVILIIAFCIGIIYLLGNLLTI
jgi:hypothetical protein